MSKAWTKSAINKIKSDIESSDLSTAWAIINDTRNNLLDSLHGSKDFVIEQDVVDKFGEIEASLSKKEHDLKTQDEKLKDDYDNLMREDSLLAIWPPPIATWVSRRGIILTRITEIWNPLIPASERWRIDIMRRRIWTRIWEYKALISESKKFDIKRPFPDMTWDTHSVSADLMKPWMVASWYNLYNENWDSVTLANYRIDIKLPDWKTENVRINFPGGVNPINTLWTLDLTWVIFTDRSGATYIPPPEYEFTLHPWAVIDMAGIHPIPTIHLVHKKPLLVKRSPAILNSLGRQTEIDNYNLTVPINRISEEIDAQYKNSFLPLQRDSVFDALKHLDGARFKQLEEYWKENWKEDEIKEELYQQIYRNFLNLWPIAWDIASINNYDNFKIWFADDSRSWNNDPAVVKGNVSYQNYVHSNLNKSVQDYMKHELDELLKNTHTNNMRLKTELSKFLTDIEERKNDDETIWGRHIHEIVWSNVSSRNKKMQKKRRKLLWFIPFWKKDINYMRFYNWANHKINEQSVDIKTNTRIADLKNSEPIKYDLKTNVGSKNQISINISFTWKDKRYIKKEIPMKKWEISSLANSILNNNDIPDFKVRVHIVYNMMISMIKIAEKKNLPLKYRFWNRSQREIKIEDNNIILYETDDSSWTRNTKTLFDYESFLTTNTFHWTGDSRSLQTGIDELMSNFNMAMNKYHEQYNKATKKRLLKTKVSANSFWTSPIKTIMNLRTVRKFDFTTNIGDVQISFEKNKITLNKGDIEISGTNLGKLLEYRKNKERVFDWLERDILFAFYDELIKKLKENSKINRTNFIVYDELTKNWYALDKEWSVLIIKNNWSRTAKKFKKDLFWKTIFEKNYWTIKDDDLDLLDTQPCSTKETKEIFMNPMIMGWIIKAMNKRM